MLHNIKQDMGELLVSQYNSILVGPDASVYAAIVLKGIVKLSESGKQIWLHKGWPPEAMVNRLQMYNNTLYACTNKGLFLYRNEEWKATDIQLPCYQIREKAGFGFAATESGLWCGAGHQWKCSAFANKLVCDFISLPHFLIVGLGDGIYFYKRDTFEWGQLYEGHSITSLAVFYNQLIATTNQGEFIVGTGRDHFEALRFGQMYASHLISKGNDVFLCTDKGLFRLGFIDDEIQLLSVKNDCLVADIDIFKNKLYMATYFSGIQTLEM